MKKKILVIVLVVLVVLVAAGYFVWTRLQGGLFGPSGQGSVPTGFTEIPSANPLEKTNPFKSLKTNPFE